MRETTLFSRRAEQIAGRILLGLVLVGLFAIAGAFGYADEIDADTRAKDERTNYVTYVRLAHPIPCRAWIRHTGNNADGKWRCAMTEKEEQ